jgi:PEP-CTERM motif
MTRTALHHPHGARRRTTVWAAAFVLTGVTLLGALGPAHAAGVPGQGTWETTLQGRDLDGNAANGFEAYYDTVLNITWLADANLADREFFGQYIDYGESDAGADGINRPVYGDRLFSDGRMTWGAASNWINAMNNEQYLGYSNWRLPDVKPVNGANFQYSSSVAAAGVTDMGFNISSPQSELAHLYHVTLGNKSIVDTAGNRQSEWGWKNTGPFRNVQPGNYWFGVASERITSFAWVLTDRGGQDDSRDKNFGFYAWAVLPGDVASPVPEPQAIALALAGLTVAGVAARRQRR